VNDATLAAVAGGVLVVLQLIVVRVMDWYFPKGRMSRRAAQNSVEVNDDDDDKGKDDKKPLSGPSA
jgi:hypothetical protein